MFIFTGSIFVPSIGIYRPSRAALWPYMSNPVSSGVLPYQYWRLLINTSNADKSYCGQWEVEFRLDAVDQATEGNAIAGSETANTKEQAFDDNTGLKWNPEAGVADSATWIGQNFGAPTKITSARFYPEYNESAPGNIQYIRVQADSQADFSTAVLLAQVTTMTAAAWNTINW